MRFTALLVSAALGSLTTRALSLDILRNQGSGTCYFASIRNEEQKGVAWIVNWRGRHYALAPAHVTSGFARNRLLCHDEDFALQLRADSPTYDLALFEILGPNEHLKAALDLEDETLDQPLFRGQKFTKYRPGESLAKVFWPAEFLMNSGLLSPRPHRESRYLTQRAPLTYRSAVNSPLAPLQNFYVFNSAIQPGMSGSPVIHFNERGQARLAGMALRVELNGFKTLVASMPDLRRIALGLSDGNDPWRRAYPEAPHFAFVGQKQQRMRAIILPSLQHQRLVDNCNLSRFSDASGSWADGSGSWADGSGDGRNGSLLVGAHHEISFWKSFANCSLEGIRFPNAEVAVAVKSARSGWWRRSPVGHLRSASDIMASLLYTYHHDPKTFSLHQIQARLHMASASPWSLYCRETTTTRYQGPAEKVEAFGTRPNPLVFMSRGSSARDGRGAVGLATCGAREQRLHYQVDFSSAEAGVWKLKLERQGAEWVGKLQMGRCSESFRQKALDPWSLTLKSEKGEARIALGSWTSEDEALVSLRVLRLHSKCRSSGSGEKALYSFEWRDL